MAIIRQGNVKEKAGVSEGYIFKIWEFRSSLNQRSKQASRAERAFLLQQINELDRRIGKHLGKKVSSTRKIENLLAKKRAFSNSGGPPIASTKETTPHLGVLQTQRSPNSKQRH